MYRDPYVDIEAFEKNIIKSYSDGENCRFCSEKDFLMVWDGSRSGLVGKGINGALGSTLVRINFPGINNSYAYYFLKSKFQEINTRAKGSGTPHVDPDLLWNYDFPIPPLNEQACIVEKIEELFSELDKGIESLNKAKSQLAVYRQALLKHAFEGKLTERWREENADKLETPEELLAQVQEERKARYKQLLSDWKTEIELWEKGNKQTKKPSKPKALDDYRPNVLVSEESKLSLPSNWTCTSFGNYLEYVTSGSRGWAKYYSDDGATFIRAQNLKYDYLDLSDIAYVSLPKKVEGKRTLTGLGDILITITGANVTKSALVTDELSEAYVSQHVALCRMINPSFSKFAFKFIISGACGRRQLEKSAYGAGKPGLNLENIKELKIPLTSVSECNAVTEILDEAESIISKLEYDIDLNIKRSSLLRQSILKQAFSGKLVPQNPTDEPASELLKKIAIEKAELEEKEKAEKAAARKAKAQAKKVMSKTTPTQK